MGQLIFIAFTEQCWCNPMNQLWITLFQHLFMHNFLYANLIWNAAGCSTFSWQTGCWCKRGSEKLCTIPEINLSCLLPALRCYVQNLISLICKHLTLIRPIYPTVSVFCNYLNFGDRCRTGWKEKRQRKQGRWKWHSTKQGKSWIENPYQIFPISFLFLFPRKDI